MGQSNIHRPATPGRAARFLGKPGPECAMVAILGLQGKSLLGCYRREAPANWLPHGVNHGFIVDEQPSESIKYIFTVRHIDACGLEDGFMASNSMSSMNELFAA